MTSTQLAPLVAPTGGNAPAVAVRGLRKSYGGRAVLDGLDLAVQTGECFALLGPNGAGKTTAIEILEGVRRRDAVEVRVLGEDPASTGRGWRARIGRGTDRPRAAGAERRGAGADQRRDRAAVVHR